MVRGPKKNGLLLQGCPGLPLLEHPLGDIAGLLRFIAHADQPRSLIRRPVRPELLGIALGGRGDHRVGSGENRLGGTIVARQGHEIGRQARSISGSRGCCEWLPPGAVDRLGIVADHGQAASVGLERQEDRGLQAIGILVFVDQHMVEGGRAMSAAMSGSSIAWCQ